MLILLPGLIYIINSYITTNIKNNFYVGVFTGICLFVSPYYWTTLLCVYGLVLISKIKTSGVKSLIKEFCLFLSSFTIFLIPYLYFYLKSKSNINYVDVMSRFGLIYSHWPSSYTNVMFGVLAITLLFISKKLIESKYQVLLFIFALSIIILNWQNVITGQALQFPSHYLVVTILFVLIILVNIADKLPKLENIRLVGSRNILTIFSILFFLILILYRQKLEYTIWVPKVPTKEYLVSIQEEADIYNWLNANTEKDSVVYSLDKKINSGVTIYTKNKVFYDYYSDFYLVSDEEIIDRWLIQNFFVRDLDLNYIENNQKDFWGNRYVDSYSFYNNQNIILSRLGFKNKIIQRYPEGIFLKVFDKNSEIRNKNIIEIFKMYKIDYLIISKNYDYYNEFIETLSRTKFASKKIDIGEYSIYQID